MAKSKLESKFELLWRAANGPALEPEKKFHPTRKWRADYAHEPTRTLIEVEGGIFMGAGGRHNRGAGYAKDAEKYLEAALAGWTVIRLTEKQLTLDWIRRIIDRITGPICEGESLADMIAASLDDGDDESTPPNEPHQAIYGRDGKVCGYAIYSTAPIPLAQLSKCIGKPRRRVLRKT